MASYKIPQNVEAEDKLIGPFTFKQFIYLIIAAIGILMAVLFYRIQPFFVVIPLPVILVFLVLGLYHREDQPVETFLLAAINFFMKPRKRVWDTEGLIETVKLTAPKRMASPRLKRLGVQEQSQLERLARIIDTRGWAVKRPELTEPLDDHTLDAADRLVEPVSIHPVEPLDIRASDDILDVYNNPVAQDFDNLAQASVAQAREAAVTKMQEAIAQPPAPVQPKVVMPKATKRHRKSQTHATQRKAAKPLPTTVKYDPYPAMHQRVIGAKAPDSRIQKLINNNDLSVSQLSKHAQRKRIT